MWGFITAEFVQCLVLGLDKRFGIFLIQPGRQQFLNGNIGMVFLIGRNFLEQHLYISNVSRDRHFLLQRFLIKVVQTYNAIIIQSDMSAVNDTFIDDTKVGSTYLLDC